MAIRDNNFVLGDPTDGVFNVTDANNIKAETDNYIDTSSQTKSESDLFEGWDGHVIIYDEPPKRDNRVACARGLIDHNGIEIFAMGLIPLLLALVIRYGYLIHFYNRNGQSEPVED